MPASRVLLSLILVLVLPHVMSFNKSSYTHVTENVPSPEVLETGEETPMMPLIEEGKLEMMTNDNRRKLEGRFQICGVCTCCGGAKGVCLASPCCYAINCNIPNRPFGLCAFTPKTCNCFNCHL